MGDSCQTSEDPESCMNPESPFAAILEELMALGGFSKIAAIVLQCVSEIEKNGVIVRFHFVL